MITTPTSLLETFTPTQDWEAVVRGENHGLRGLGFAVLGLLGPAKQGIYRDNGNENWNYYLGIPKPFDYRSTQALGHQHSQSQCLDIRRPNRNNDIEASLTFDARV